MKLLKRTRWFFCAISVFLALSSAAAVSAFSPNYMTRGEFLTLLCSKMSMPEDSEQVFADVSPASPYFEAVSKAYAAGIAEGADGFFRPDELITRQDAAVFTLRRLEKEGYEKCSVSLAEFPDGGRAASYADTALYVLWRFGIYPTEDTSLRPDENAEQSWASELVNCADASEIAVPDSGLAEKVLKYLGIEDGCVDLSPVFRRTDGLSEAYCTVYKEGYEYCRAHILLGGDGDVVIICGDEASA